MEVTDKKGKKEEIEVIQCLRDNAGMLMACYQYGCCSSEMESVASMSSDGFSSVLASCHTIDNARIRAQDLKTVFKAMTRESALGHHVRPLQTHSHHHSHSHSHHSHRHQRTPSPAKTRSSAAKRKKKIIPPHLSFPSFLVAIVRTSILKYSHVAVNEVDAVAKYLSMNLFQAGQLLFEPFRVRWLYTAPTYEVLHEHEGLFNSLFRRFSNKHPTKEELASAKLGRNIKHCEHSSRRKKSSSGKKICLNLPEFVDLLTTTKTIHFVSSGGDRRQCTRQEIAFIFRLASGPDPLGRGLSLPQFLDAIARCALLMCYRDRRDRKDMNAEDCYHLFGVYPHGGGVPQNKMNDSIAASSNESDSDEEDENSSSRKLYSDDAVEEGTEEEVDETHTWQRAIDSGKTFEDTLNLGKAIAKYIVTPFDVFSCHG
jgi:hypothetical protein